MILEIFLLGIIGLIIGVITALIPGLHTNTVSVILISVSPFLLKFFEPLAIVIFIISLTITNLFIEFIPATFLGLPEEDKALFSLPAHKKTLQGQGYQAVQYSCLGAIIGIFLSMLLTPIFFLFLEKTYSFFEMMMPWMLLWVAILIVWNNENRLLATVFAILSGFLGFASLNLNLSEPLLPLLTGLYGTSSLILSIKQKVKLPEQKITNVNIREIPLKNPLINSAIVSPFCSFLPGLGSSQATAIGSRILKNLEENEFLVMTGILNSCIMCLSFITLILIDKSRTGSASAIRNIMEITSQDLRIIFISILIASFISFLLAKNISEKVSKKLPRINYSNLSIWITLFLIGITLTISGILGLLVLMASTLLGITCQTYNINKGTLMNCLLIPTILIYLVF